MGAAYRCGPLFFSLGRRRLCFRLLFFQLLLCECLLGLSRGKHIQNRRTVSNRHEGRRGKTSTHLLFRQPFFCCPRFLPLLGFQFNLFLYTHTRLALGHHVERCHSRLRSRTTFCCLHRVPLFLLFGLVCCDLLVNFCFLCVSCDFRCGCLLGQRLLIHNKPQHTIATARH